MADTPEPAPEDRSAARQQPDPDVLLDVPDLGIENLNLTVQDLRARVSLHAQVLDLLSLDVGADVTLGRVELDITGVHAKALLKVRLDNVAEIVGGVLRTIDRNPQILERITEPVGAAAESLGKNAGRAVGELGQGSGRAVEEAGGAVGDTVRKTGDAAGETVRKTGDAATGAVREAGDAAGDTVRKTGDAAGETVQKTGDTAGDAAQEAQDRAGGGVDDITASAETSSRESGGPTGHGTRRRVQRPRPTASGRRHGRSGDSRS